MVVYSMLWAARGNKESTGQGTPICLSDDVALSRAASCTLHSLGASNGSGALLESKAGEVSPCLYVCMCVWGRGVVYVLLLLISFAMVECDYPCTWGRGVVWCGVVCSVRVYMSDEEGEVFDVSIFLRLCVCVRVYVCRSCAVCAFQMLAQLSMNSRILIVPFFTSCLISHSLQILSQNIYQTINSEHISACKEILALYVPTGKNSQFSPIFSGLQSIYWLSSHNSSKIRRLKSLKIFSN
jgi:hypothetical protein